jgi:hypothetical protein
MRNEYKILVGEPEQKRPHRTIKMGLKGILVRGCLLGPFGSG